MVAASVAAAAGTAEIAGRTLLQRSCKTGEHLVYRDRPSIFDPKPGLFFMSCYPSLFVTLNSFLPPVW